MGGAAAKLKTAVVIVMNIESLPVELIPMLLMTPYEVVAARLTSKGMLSKIPRDLFKLALKTAHMIRWESQYWRVYFEHNDTTGGLSSGAAPLDGPMYIWPGFKDNCNCDARYAILVLAIKFTCNELYWWRFVSDILVYTNYGESAGSRDLVEVLDSLSLCDGNSGMVMFGRDKKYKDVDVRWCISSFESLLPLLHCAEKLTLFKLRE